MPASSRSTRVAIALIVVLSTLTLCLVVYLVLPSTRGVATQQAQLRQQERQDCARVIASERNDILDARDNAGWRALLAVGIGDDAAFAKYTKELDDAIKKVDELEPPQVLVDRRCPKV